MDEKKRKKSIEYSNRSVISHHHNDNGPEYKARLFCFMPLDGPRVCGLVIQQHFLNSNLIFDNTAVPLYAGYAFSARLIPFSHNGKINTTNRHIKNTKTKQTFAISYTKKKVQIFNSQGDSVKISTYIIKAQIKMLM